MTGVGRVFDRMAMLAQARPDRIAARPDRIPARVGRIPVRADPIPARRSRIALDGSAGFTLLELLVVLVVLGFLMVGVAQGLHLGVQLWDRQQRELNAVAELDATGRALRQLIEQMDPGGRFEMPDIDGTAHTLRFTTRLPATAGASPTRRAEVVLLVDRLHRLLLRWTPSPHVVPLVAARPVETVLLDGVEQIQISYKPRAPGAAWQPVWQYPIPPLLVRIHIAFAPSDPRNWPDLVAMPMRMRGG
ncbi:MAG TPA: prepilin-type N-terminal cleavage/methylation domain-containing protein [Acetobacteraceae bacterium]|nr:prepilin-type N-terminal cleavage/methylation domain-containing protein [Acetobacteraceae bacterium]